MPKKHLTRLSRLFLTAALSLGCFTIPAYAQRVRVTITNLTSGQTFTPIMAATHQRNVALFMLGRPASTALARLAEAGDNSQIEADLKANPDVLDVQDSGGPLAPGHSVTLTLKVQGPFDHLSVAAMLIPTNDGFFAVNNASISQLRSSDDEDQHSLRLWSPVYDAGTKKDDELCANIPGPAGVCGGTGFVPQITGPNFVFIHSGIHGIGDLEPAKYDWRNPAAKITVSRIAEGRDDGE